MSLLNKKRPDAVGAAPGGIVDLHEGEHSTVAARHCQNKSSSKRGNSVDKGPAPQSPKGVAVTLERHEQWYATEVGKARNRLARASDAKCRYGQSENDSLRDDIDGALAENAVAKHLGIYWPVKIATYKDGGGVGLYEVRYRTKVDYNLIVRRDDDGGKVFILVVGSMPTYRLIGWMFGQEAKRDQWLKAYGGRPPAWFVPQSALHDLSCLPDLREWPRQRPLPLDHPDRPIPQSQLVTASIVGDPASGRSALDLRRAAEARP